MRSAERSFDTLPGTVPVGHDAAEHSNVTIDVLRVMKMIHNIVEWTHMSHLLDEAFQAGYVTA